MAVCSMEIQCWFPVNKGDRVGMRAVWKSASSDLFGIFHVIIHISERPLLLQCSSSLQNQETRSLLLIILVFKNYRKYTWKKSLIVCLKPNYDPALHRNLCICLSSPLLLDIWSTHQRKSLFYQILKA